MISLLCGLKLKVTDEQTRQTKMQRHGQQHGGYQREGGWGVLNGRGGTNIWWWKKIWSW